MRGVLLVLALLVALRAPFLDQAIQGDDIYYLAGGQYAQIDPLHPNHARYVFLGQEVDMRGHPHPPLNAWFLGLLLALWNDVHEVRFHAAYLLFSVIAALAMLSLARRFSRRPLWAALLFLVTPAFVVNGGSLESDIPFLAFWMASAALFVAAVDARSVPRLAMAALALALASLAAFQALAAIPVFGLYLWQRGRRWRLAWVALATPVAVIAGWQIFERLSTGALPAQVLAGYFQTYGLQTLANKVRNAAALTAHLGWVLSPALAMAAFAKGPRWPLAVAAAGALGAAFIDPHPLFWASAAVGLLVLSGCLARLRGEGFLAGWLLIFFAAALALFFAGSARYLLPLAAPLAILASNAVGPRWLAAGFLLQAALSLSLAVVNFEHWDGYRAFVHSMRDDFASRRVWINGEWGLRFYAEAEGGLPLRQGQAVQPGEMVLSSRLAYPIDFTTGGGVRAPVARMRIEASLPLRLIALGSKSAYSTASGGLRPFDFGRGPIDIVEAYQVSARAPTLEYLPMGAPEAEWQILSGLYQAEGGGWRWMGRRASLLLKAPAEAMPVEAEFRLLEQSGRTVGIWVDERLAVSRTYPVPGTYTLRSPPIKTSGNAATVVVSVDKSFRTHGDRRELGMILSAAGFRR